MKYFVIVIVIAVALGGNPVIAPAAFAQSDETEETVERLFGASAMAVDSALPELPFETWLSEVLPEGSGKIFGLAECSSEVERVLPHSCLVLDAVIVSRHRKLHLEFDGRSLAFHGGVMSSEELEGTIAVESLAELSTLLRQAMRPFPLPCPANVVLRLRESYAGLFEWCEDAEGNRQGAARSWFSTGIYLLERGQYADGIKTGGWIECNRFERCSFNTYVNGVLQ